MSDEADLLFGETRRIRYNTIQKTEIVFMVVLCICIVITSVLSIIKMVNTSPTDTEFTFALFVLFNAVFCTIYVIHGVLKERPHELGILLIAVFSMSLYTVLNSSAVDKKPATKVGRLALVCVISIPIMLFCVKYGLIYNNSENYIKRTVGNDSSLQGMCKTLYLFHDLLKLDLQLGISMVILILNTTDDVAYDDYIVLSFGGIFCLVWFTIGYRYSRIENKLGMVFFFLGGPLEPCYVLYKMVMSEEQTKTNLKSASLTCGYLALVFRVLLIIYSVLVWRNFGKGLRERVNTPTPGNSDSSVNSNENLNQSTTSGGRSELTQLLHPN